MRFLISLSVVISFSHFANAFACENPTLAIPRLSAPIQNGAPDPVKSAENLLTDFFEKRGQQLTIKDGFPWARMLAELENGNIDLIAPMLKTPEREEKYLFSDSWASDQHGVIVHKDRLFGFQSAEDLTHRNGAYLNGAAFPEPYRSYIQTHDNLTVVYDLDSLSKMLDQKRVDFILAPIGSLFRVIPEKMQDGRFVTLGRSVISTPLYIAFSRKSDCKNLIPALNAFIQEKSVPTN